MTPITVLIADDHELVRRGLRMTIQAEDDMQLLGEAKTGSEAVALVTQLHPQVVLMDIQMPDMDGVQAVQAIRAHAANAQVMVLMLTSYNTDAQVYAALKAGANGYLLKEISGDDLAEAIRRAVKGDPQLHPQITRKLMQAMPAPINPLDELSERERDVLRLIAQGRSNKEIGQTLSLTEVTIKGYVSTMLSKLHVEDRTQAALLAVKLGLVELG